jgi:two-component system NtrC family sensor kinase
MRTLRHPALLRLRLLIIAAVSIPAALVAYTGWSTYWDVQELVEERSVRTLDVLYEHALKVMQTTERLLDQAAELLRDKSDEEIRAAEALLRIRLVALQESVPEVQSIWAFDRNGLPLLSSTVFPVPKDLNNSDRDYFRGQASDNQPVYIGSNIKARVGNLTFFVASKRRHPQSAFNGVVALTLPPDALQTFYERLTRGSGIAAGLLREDGSVLARYPMPPGGLAEARTTHAFTDQLSKNPHSGAYTTVSGLDNTKRRIAYRKVGSFPVYVSAAYDTNTFWPEFIDRISRIFILGILAIITLATLGYIAIERSRKLFDELERREAAERTLRESQRLEALGQLTGGVAHDFNNLLMVIQGNSDRLNRDLLSEAQKRALRSIEQATRSGVHLTRQLLAFSRKQAVNPQPINLRERIPQLEDMLRASIRKDIQIQFSFSNDLWTVCVDPAELDLAILNLAVNARDAMPDGGLLTFSARNSGTQDSEHVLLSIKDTGAGISTEHLSRIFEPFFSTKGSKGTGLGLSQVYGFVTQSSGKISVQSNSGQGTEFTVALPRCTDIASARTGALNVKECPARILLVEDNLAVADVTKDNLQALGHEVTHVTSGDEAWMLLQSETYDCVFSDIVMPGDINGVELARRLRQLSNDIVIVLASGYSHETAAAISEGFFVLQKPYSLDALRKQIAEGGPSNG